MENSRNRWGWLAVVFGWVGLLICVVVIVGVWVLSARLGNSVDRAVGKVAGFTAQLSAASEQVEERIGEAGAGIVEFESQLKQAISGTAEDRGVDLEKLGETVGKLRLVSKKVENWVAAAESTRDVVAIFGELLGSIGFVLGDEGEQVATISTGLEQIREVTLQIDGSVEALEVARAAPQLTVDEVEPLMERIGGGLSKLGDRTSVVSDGIRSIGESATDLQERVSSRITFWSVVVTLLLAWGGAGQIALARWGSATGHGVK